MIHGWGLTDRGAVRAQNQDCYYLKQMGDDVAAAVVCDGMGGARAGNVASALAVEVASAFLESMTAEELIQDPAAHLTRAVNLSNDAVYRKALGDLACMGMGTTMVAAILHGGHVWVLNVGDSRAYHVGEEGITRVTRDHSVVEDMVHRGEITPEEARVHPQKNLITRCLGSEPRVKPDLFELELKPGEHLLLCTDGLSNLVTDQELLYEVLHGGAAEGCCKRLLELTLSRGAPDNVTAVLIQYV